MQAVQTIHQPQQPEQAEDARRRLAFDELLTMQLQLLLQRDFARCACSAGPCSQYNDTQTPASVFIEVMSTMQADCLVICLLRTAVIMLCPQCHLA